MKHSLQLGLMLLAACVARPVPGEPPAVPNELIVLFARDSREHAQVVEAVKRPQGDLGSLGALVRELSKAARVPLRASRVGGGGELVVSIDEEGLLESVAAAFRDRSGGTVTRLEGPALAVRIFVIAQEKLAGDVADVGRRLGVPLRTRPAANDAVVVEIPRDELATTLAARLRAVPQVEAVERNLMMQPGGGGAAR